jgi:hypothetical protein
LVCFLERAPWDAAARRRRLYSSGKALEVFELLSIEDVLVTHAPGIGLGLIISARSALLRWPDDARARLEALLGGVAAGREGNLR